MRYQRWIASVFLTLLLTSAQAQVRGRTAGSSSRTGSVHVHVVFADDRRAGSNLLVQLMQGSSSTPVATTYTNDAGEADFASIPVGNYHVVVTGGDIQAAQGELFDIDPRRLTQSEYVTVHRVEDSRPKTVGSKSPMVSASELNVPAKARKEVEKAEEAMSRRDWEKALERLNKAVAIDPQYAAAYNNLGVLYARMNDSVHEREALEKAISLDDHLSAAYVNLAKLCLREKNFPKAEMLLGKAVSVEPSNAENLMLLANAQYMDHHYEAAIASARQAHASSNTHPAFVHYIAARAYDMENRREEALAELQIFLSEEPTGPRADHVRAAIQSQQRPAQ